MEPSLPQPLEPELEGGAAGSKARSAQVQDPGRDAEDGLPEHAHSHGARRARTHARAGGKGIMRQASPHSCPNRVIHEATDCTCKVISASSGLPRATRLASYRLSFCSFCKARWKADASQFSFHHLWPRSWALPGDRD